MSNIDKKKEDFLQGFACGWCLCVDMIRKEGMDRLPDPRAQAMVATADSMESCFKSNGLGELLKEYQTHEDRAILLKHMLERV